MTASNIESLATLILGMTYGELRDVAASLQAMCIAVDDEGKLLRGVPVDAQDFTDLLHDWAEAQ
jgi:hypothetical protein